MALFQNIVTLAATGILALILIISGFSSANAKLILLTELMESSTIPNLNSTENVTSSTGSPTTSLPAPSTSSPQVVPNNPVVSSKKVVSLKEGERRGRFDPSVNPFPFYYPPQLGGSTGNGVAASSCAYAYPNRRYSCYGLGRK